MTSDLQRALRSGKTPENLFDELSIKWKRHPEYHNLILFCYDQIHSPKLNPIVMSARGHILDEDNNWEHACRPFDRFFNYGEVQNDLMDYDRAIFFKKEDGSLINMWYYKNKWNVSTKGSPDASGFVGGEGFTYRDLANNVWNDSGYLYPDFHKNETFCFEICTKYNKVVCHQIDQRLILTGVRNSLTGFEKNPSLYQNLGYDICKIYDIANIQDGVSKLNDISGTILEGYVAAQFMNDGTVLRTKVKNKSYVLMHHLKEGISEKKILDLVRRGEESECLTYFPEFTDEFYNAKNRFKIILLNLEEAWRRSGDIVAQKDFAISIKNVSLNSVLFKKRKDNKSIREYLMDINIDSLFLAIKSLEHK